MSIQAFAGIFPNLIDKKNILSYVTMIIVLVALQALMNINFSCPCKIPWNFLISCSAFVVPPLFVLTAMCTIFKCLKCSQQQQNGSSELENISCRNVCILSITPAFIWVSLLFLNGDYLACLLTNWDGQYACYNELRPECLNWCKPYQNHTQNETDLHEKTKFWINLSKVCIV